MPDRTLTHLSVQTNGVRLHAVAAGSPDGSLVVLLHGFPEFWYGWREQIPALADAGFRVLAPDQRGYNTSEKPPGIAAYAVDELVGDVLGLLDALGRDRALIAGHDWGANVAWRLAMAAPERVERMAILNVPHPRAFLRAFETLPRQWLRSWYILLFQLPWLPEALSGRSGLRLLERTLVRPSRPGTFTPEDLERYWEAWAQPGALRAMIDWYRAPRLDPTATFPSARVRVPTLVVWGARDAFLAPQLTQWSADLCDDSRLVIVEDATHWIQHEEPWFVSETLISFFREGVKNSR